MTAFRRLVTTAFRLGALLFVVGLALPAYAEPIVHQATGIVFPDEIAGFSRSGVKDYESERAGLGFSYAYKTTTGVAGTIYVYTAGLSSVPTAIDHPVMGQLRNQTISEIEQFARSRNEAVRPGQKGTLKVSTDSGEVTVLFDSFIVSSPSGARNTFVWLWSSRGHFLKIRVTREPTGVLDAKQLREFYETVVRLAASPRDAKRRVNISLAKSPSPTEMAVRMAYGLGLSDWINKNQLTNSAPEGPFIPSFEAELHARQSQLQVWRELKEKGTPDLPYMVGMLRVASSGYFREYLWKHHRQATWGEPPADLRMDAFMQWSVDNLHDHVPQTGAQVVFGPPVAK